MRPPVSTLCDSEQCLSGPMPTHFDRLHRAVAASGHWATPTHRATPAEHHERTR